MFFFFFFSRKCHLEFSSDEQHPLFLSVSLSGSHSNSISFVIILQAWMINVKQFKACITQAVNVAVSTSSTTQTNR